MLEYDDLCPLDTNERLVFYDLDWYMKYLRTSNVHPYKYSIVDVYSGLYYALYCGKVVGDHYGCTLRKNHLGKCVCWHPDSGVLKVAE